MISLILFLLACNISPALATISLSGFQQITGFPDICTNTYNEAVSACEPSDFGPGHSCSGICVLGLQALQSQIQINCQGVNVDPSSVIGHFFSSSGPDYVCSGITYNANFASSVLATLSIESTTSLSTTTCTTTESATASTTNTHIDTSTTTETTKSHSQHTPTNLSTSASTNTHTAISGTIVTTRSPSQHSNAPTAISTTIETTTSLSQHSTVSHSTPGSTNSASATQNLGGGGSPFDVTSNGAGRGFGTTEGIATVLVSALTLVGLILG